MPEKGNPPMHIFNFCKLYLHLPPAAKPVLNTTNIASHLRCVTL